VTAAPTQLSATWSVARESERAVAMAYLGVGAVLVYLVLFDQGQASDIVLGPLFGQHNVLHELFHDGRHLANAPCH
jgi:Probable cobalt transporter subunit (CbtB)